MTSSWTGEPLIPGETPETIYRNTLDLNRFSNSVAKKLVTSYNRIIIDTTKKLEKIEKMPRAKQPAYKAARLRSLLRQVKNSLDGWSNKSADSIIKDLDGIAKLQSEFATAQIAKALPSGVESVIHPINISDSFAKSVVNTSPTQLNASLLSDDLKGKVTGKFSLTAKQGALINLPNGKSVRKSFRGLAASQADRFGKTVRDGMLIGETTPQIASRLIGTLSFGQQAKSVKQIALAGGELTKMANHQIQTIVHSAVQQVANTASQTVYKSNSDITKKYRYVATLDARTSPICRNLDGEEFLYGKGPEPLQHFRCRSTTVAVIDYEGLGVSPPSKPLGPRAASGGSVPAGTTYGKWLSKQDQKVKGQALGKGKVKYFNAMSKKYGPDQAIKKFVQKDGSEKTLTQLQKTYGKTPTTSKKLKPTPKVAKAPVKTKTTQKKAVDELIKKEGKYMAPVEIEKLKSGKLNPKDYIPLTSAQKKMIDLSVDEVTLKKAEQKLVAETAKKEKEKAAKAKALGIDPTVVKSKKASAQKIPKFGTKEYDKWKKDITDEIKDLKKDLGKATKLADKATSDYDFDKPLSLDRKEQRRFERLHGIRRAEEYTAEAKRNKAKLRTLKSEFKKKTTDKIYNTDYKYKGEDLVKDEWVDLGPARIKKMGYIIDDKRLDGTKVKGWSSEFEFLEDAVSKWKGGSRSYQAVQAYRLDKAGVKLSNFGKSRARTGQLLFDPKNKTKAEIKRKKAAYDRFAKKADALEKFVERSPTYSGEIKRGVQLDPDKFHNFIQDLVDGNQSAVMESWSSDWETANDFAGIKQIGKKFYTNDRVWEEGSISARLTVKKNKYGSSIQELGDGFTHEKEVLIPSKVRYQVVDIKTTPILEDGTDDVLEELWEITLEQI